MFTTTLSKSLAVVIAMAGSLVSAQAQNYYHPFGPDSIWNRTIPGNASYVPANLVLGGIAVDVEWIYATNGGDPSQPVYQPPQYGSYYVNNLNLYDAFYVPNVLNGCASFLLPDGATTQEYNLFSRTNYGGSAQGLGWPGSNIYSDGLDSAYGGHAGSGLSTMGGSIRQYDTENGASINHALKIELDWAQLYSNPGAGDNQAETYRWPATNSDGNFPGGYGNPPGYYGSNPALREGSLLAIPWWIDVTQLGLSPVGLQIAYALQNYGAYVVDSSGIGYYYGSYGYINNLCVEEGENTNYFINGNPDNPGPTSFYYDMATIWPYLEVVDSNNQ